MKYVNIAIFGILCFLYLIFASHISFSTNFIEIFFSKKSLQLFSVAKKLGLSNEILISTKGFDEKSLNELNKIAKILKKTPLISKVELSHGTSKDMKEYFRKNYYLLADFNNSKITKNDIKKRLQKIHDDIYSSVLYQPVNTYDPLGLFSLNFGDGDGYQRVKNYGYLLRAETSVDTADAESARVIYDKINSILKNYPDAISFAPFYFLVENSAYIRGDAQKIMLISSMLLLLLYFVILKNHKLFFNAVLAIGSSILSAILLTSLFFKSISILAVVFGVSITSISIDYMFHYYFHGYFSAKKRKFQKRVFFGFLTTVGVFVIFSFIDIELFAQLAIFSVISLSVAYMLFTWAFVYLDIKAPIIKAEQSRKRSFNPLFVMIVSLILFGFAYFNLSFDSNLKNLDYHNTKLLKLSKIFRDGLQNDRYRAIIIEARSREKLLQKYEKIEDIYPKMLGIGKFILSHKKCQMRIGELKKQNFKKVKDSINELAKKMGFSKKTFKNAYYGVDKTKCQSNIVDGTKFKIINDKGSCYTMALIQKSLLKPSTLYEIVDLGKTLAKDTKDMKDRLEIYMILSVVFIIGVLFFTFGKEMLYPLAYLLFPLSVVLFSISFFGKINIMHIFALVILIAISIDYGIYLHKTKTLKETRLAIRYALLSTFFGFGVLIFSKTAAMHSIGFVITVGIGSIFFLLYGKIVPLKK
ncbi:MAG: hypothetical protein QM482_08550 [Sulfurospirillum sp.]